MTFLVVVSMNAGCHPLYAIQNQKFHMLCFDKRFKCLSVSDEWFILKFDREKWLIIAWIPSLCVCTYVSGIFL